MGTIIQTAAGGEAGRPEPEPTVRVWDPLVRLLHWSLAACVFGAFLVEEGDTAHRVLGYIAMGLVALRVLWGFFGTPHARFRDWVRGPRAVSRYLHERLTGSSRRRLGHNPAAGVVMLTLDAFWGAQWLENLHEVLAWGLLGLIGLHVLAALVESFHYRENLIAAMLHGRKRPLDGGEPPP
jgi:cytochrome b